MQKKEIKFAKHRTNGFILDFLVKSLDIYQKEDKLQKRYQEFIKEGEISAGEYYDTQNIIIEDILYKFFGTTNSDEYRYFEKLLKELLSFYSLYKLNNETLATSQKQLDFIVIINLFIPFLSHLVFDSSLKYKKELDLIVSILPDEKENSIQKLFNLLQSTFKNDISLKEKIENLLEPKEKYRDYNRAKENYNNWINGNNTPTNEHIKLLSQLAIYSDKYSEKELKVLFQCAKLIQYLYSKSKEYFGVELTSLIVKHYKMISMISLLHVSKKFDIFVNSFKARDLEQIEVYLEQYFYESADLFYMLDYFVKNLDYPNKIKDMKAYILENRNKFDILYKIDEKTFFNKIESILPIKYFDKSSGISNFSNITIQNIDKNFYEFSQESSTLYEYVEPTNEKNEESETSFLEALKKLEDKFDLEKDPYSLFMKARLYAQKREYKESAKYYLQALEHGKNSIGLSLKTVIREGLFVSAQDTRKEQLDLINAKSSFTKFYKEAYFYKLIDNLPEEINIHFLLDMKKQFDIYFKNLFPGIAESKATNITSNFAAVVTKDLENIKIDFNNPNKWIKKGLPNKITQLMYCCQMSKLGDVKKLLKANVDVNEKKGNDNCTALICSFGSTYNTSEDQVEIMKLLIPKMTTEALDAKIVKEKETAMSYAIAKGFTDIVKLMIDYNVNLNEKCTLDDISYLYYVIQLINMSTYSSMELSNFLEYAAEAVSSSKEKSNAIIKANPLINNIFEGDANFDFSKINENIRHKKIWDEFKTFISKYYSENAKNYYKIFDLLIENMENVDIKEKNTFSPLIFATKINDEYLVKRLLEKGANPDYYTGQNKRAYDYAEFNKNEELMDLLY
ncbi:hypothetical protein CRV01_11250 [Arcobacter sp. CECT 8983]|uniref:ankyrin repeat domain-containing protein n=1 Tax=Arcobacter sp. CECT 8983 TaxID=2044508 RepID=UPI00100BDFFD|nr:ankyrin repeat domain-containing protein [Arcobacter sp. CECT 8983]RXJ89182.1 hypothetical protein CRV01_11250 [Arcobacter sp. CECT 8983]